MSDMSGKSDADCCADGHAGQALKLDEALARILADARPVEGIEILAVRSALGRVLASDVVSGIDVPAHTNSAMDGYALAGGDIAADGETRLAIIGVAAAGQLRGRQRPVAIRRGGGCFPSNRSDG